MNTSFSSLNTFISILFDTNQQLFIDSCQNGNHELVGLLLEFYAYHNDFIQHAICWVSENSHIAVIDRLLQEGRVDPSANNNHAIRYASARGHIAVVDRLLQEGRVDPSANNNSAIRWASRNGHIAVVDRLLQDRRVDPSADNNFAIRVASQSGHIAVVDRLKQYRPRVNFVNSLIQYVHLFLLTHNLLLWIIH